MLENAGKFLIDVIFGLFTYALLLRFVMQVLRAPFRNPAGQAVMALTDWIVKPLRNFRWNESPLTMLNRIVDIGRAERVGPGAMMPSLKVRDFNFASLSEAV